METDLDKINKIFQSPFVHMTDEKQLQAEIAQRFDEHGIEYSKEIAVTGGVIDFLVCLLRNEKRIMQIKSKNPLDTMRIAC